MKIGCSRYSLKSCNKGEERHGALLRFDFGGGLVGYGDCHPWTSLGDDNIEDQLRMLSQRRFTKQTARAHHYAKLDANARKELVSLFAGLQVPKSNLLVGDLSGGIQPTVGPEFDYVKVKVGKDLTAQLPLLKVFIEGLPEKVKVRLDFNQKLDEVGFRYLLKELRDLLPRIDYFEDPFPFHSELWTKVQKECCVTLAADRGGFAALGDHEAARVLVLKPAIQDVKMFFFSKVSHQKLVVTSYCDHPLGQAFAAYEAARISHESPGRLSCCGLLTHHLFHDNDYTAQLKSVDSRLIPPQGTGIGFDQLLENEKWEPLL